MNYIIYTDGSSGVGKGPWGWAAIILDKDNNVVNKLSGGGPKGTNSIAELTAVLEGIKSLPFGASITVVSDSQYVVNAFNKGWLISWKRNGWRRSSGQVRNLSLWQEIDQSIANHKIVNFVWVRGHNGDEWNEKADQLAGEAKETYKTEKNR